MPTPTSPVLDLGALRRAGDAAAVRTAAAPVRFVTTEFLAALNCRHLGSPASLPTVRVLRAV
jgi:hypothetical protein